MLFNSYIFLVFLVIVLAVHYSLPQRFRKYFLILASYVFYGYWNWAFCSLLLLTTVTDFYVGKFIYEAKDEKRKKHILWFSIFINLAVLGFFKYFQFFVDSINPVAGMFGGNLDFVHLNIILPVGISFYTFQSMSYALDVYRGNMKPGESIIDFMLYVSFFPQLVAGPIERATHLLSQVSELPKPTREQVKTGIILIVTGMFKKVLIGDTTGRVVDNIFAQPHIYTSDELLCGLLLFSIQIYADFSGYSSIARGTGRLFGVELMRNFEQPYFSANITEFWRRWHISLSSWLKDYLYISLGGNRKGEFRTYVNLIITMLLGGLWHGANWTFVIWGGLHGLYLSVHKLILGDKKPADRFSYTGFKSLLVFIAKVAFTLLLVNLAWLFFRAASINEAFFILGKIFEWQTGEFLWRFIQITAAFSIVTLLMDFFEYYTRRHAFLIKLKSLPVRYAVMAAMAVTVLLYMYQSEPLPFIYFQF